MNHSLILASQSPRRAELLRQMALPFVVLITDVDESRQKGEAPCEYVKRLAVAKCQAGFGLAESAQNIAAPFVVIGADTIVVIDDEILGKPRGLKESVAMLKRLAGRTHTVLSGVAVGDGTHLESTVVSSVVTFAAMTDQQINAYWSTGEGRDKAGSYGIQGIGGIFVERIEGSFSSVMGLPVRETEVLLRRLNVNTWSIRSQWLKNS